VSGSVPIVELVDVCERMTAVNRRLFEVLGAWVADEPDPQTQRALATATHRHAWHAELWSDRRPKIPVDTSGRIAPIPDPSGDRNEWYRAVVDAMLTELDDLSARIDPALDPSTTRVIQLVTADLA